MKYRDTITLNHPWVQVSLVVLCVLMVRVWEHVQAERLEHQLKGLHLEADRLTYENGRLQVQIHQYEAPSNLEALAKTTFAMIPVDPSHRVGLQP